MKKTSEEMDNATSGNKDSVKKEISVLTCMSRFAFIKTNVDILVLAGTFMMKRMLF